VNPPVAPTPVVRAPRRPTAGSDAATIVEIWLPELFAATSKKWEGSSPELRLTLSGPGGGDWALQVVDGHLVVERVVRAIGVRRADPDIWIRMPTADFLAVPFPDEDLFALVPRDADLIDLLFAQAHDIELLEKLDGRIRFELEGRRRRRWSLDVAFGPAGMAAGRPRTTVTIDGGTCERLAERSITPLQALLAGRLRVDGDRVLAMQVLMLAASRIGG
jgi:hypothetical protein